MTGWSLIVHGGAKAIAPDKADPSRTALIAAVRAGAEVLQAGGSALDAAEAAIVSMEDAPVFNAGYGSVLNADGEVEMDAALIEGTTLRAGAVGAIRGVRHPVSVARAVLDETPVLLVGEGARRFAEAKGMALCDPAEMIAPGVSFEQGGLDTVGCVARDVHGRLAAGTSTGGLAGKTPGRVGDSPLPGCGLYAMDAVGGVSVSGDGDKIARVLLAARVMQHLEGGDGPSAASAAALEAMDWVGGEGGIIALDARGRLGCAHNSPHFAMGGATAGRPRPQAWLHRDELYEAMGNE